MNRKMVKIGSRLKYGPSIKKLVPWVMISGIQLVQLISMSGAARFEHHQTFEPNKAEPRSSTSTPSPRNSPMKIGI